MPNDNGATKAQEPQGNGLLTQQQVNEIVQGRIADYVKSVNELTKRAEAAEKSLAELQAQVAERDANDAHLALVSKVAAQTGLDPAIVASLAAEDEASLMTAAQAIASLVVKQDDEAQQQPATPMYVPGFGYAPEPKLETPSNDPLGDFMRAH